MIVKKIITFVLTALMAFSMMPSAAFAADWGQGDTLEDALSELKVGFDSTQLDWLVLPNLGVINLRYTYFMFKNERTGTIDEHPVYCIDPTKAGAYGIVAAVGMNTDGSNTATYIRGERVGDAKYKSILAAGYPHMMYESLGLASREEGYYATKLALWMYIRGNDPTKLTINPKYTSSDPVALRVRGAAVNIYTNGVNKSYNYTPSLTLTGKPSPVARLDSNGEYYVQQIEVHASSYIGTAREGSGDVQLLWESPPPAGTIVLGSNGEDISTSLIVKMDSVSGKSGYYGNVTVKYLASSINISTFSPPTLKAQAIVNNNEIYAAYAKANKDKYQRYLVERDPKVLLTAAFVSQVNEPFDEDFPDGSGLRIRKVEAGTKIPLEGAVFEIRDPDGKLIYSMATNEGGIIDLPLSVMGNYTVTETVPPQYHLLPDVRTQSVSVRYNEMAEVTFTDEPYGELRVVKRDAKNGSPLGGATVQIKNISTNMTQESQTDSSGSAYFDKLPVGAYEIKEITAPDGYALDTNVHTVNVVPFSEGETSYTLTNEANPGLRITKFDQQSMIPIEGVTFEVWCDGELYGTFITDEWGEIELHDLPAGTYIAREVATAPGYVLDSTAQWIELKAGQGYISDLVFLNLTKPGIRLLKIDSETFSPLVNARFLIKLIGGPFAKEYTTDENGEINLSELDPGSYSVEELNAPDGYLIDDAIRTIQINGGENAQFVFTDSKKPVFELFKLDSKTGKPLAGAVFRVALIKDGSHYLDRVSDTQGKIRIDNLMPGTYSVTELSAPEGYVKDETEYHVQLFPGKASTLVVNNAHKPDLKILKRDEKTGELLAGASFTVRKADSATLESVTTDANGEAWLYKLDQGVYEIIETLPPAGYLPNDTPRLITLFPNRTGVAQFVNAKKPGITILKVDAVTAKPLVNAEFSIKYKDGAIVWEGLTDKNGQIHLAELQANWYTITEILPPSGYLSDTAPKDVRFEPGKNLQVKFDNTRKPVVIFLKTNAITGKGIPGATFSVDYEMPNGGVKNIGSFKTGSDGRIIIPKAELGWYTFTETMPAPGFALPKNPVTRMYVDAGQNAYLAEFEHFYTGVSVGLADQEQENQGNQTENQNTDNEAQTESHSGNEYRQGENFNWPLNSVVIKKTHAITGELLEGAAFELYRADEQVSGVPGTCIGRYTTDNSGVVVITGLEPGYYIVKEVQAPQNFLISENSQQNGFLKADGTSVLEFTFANYPYGSILITKVDTLTGKPLPNARFKVTDSSGAVVGNTNGEYITDAGGEIMIPDVKPGSYVITEIEAPEHYTIDTTPQTLEVGKDGKVYKSSFKNKPAGALTILKLDSATRQPLAGAEFKVTDSSGAVVGTENGRYVTDATGQIIIPNLPKGTYIVQETKAPAGYFLENQRQIIAVDYGKAYTLEFLNQPMSGLLIIKTDENTGKPLAGVRFEVKKANGEQVGIFTTDKSGRIYVNDISAGKYVIVETATLDGYVLDSAAHEVTVYDGKQATVEVKNKQLAGLRLIKIDSITKKPIYNVEFMVFDRSNKVVGTYYTDNNGVIDFAGILTEGRYTIRETRAASGYYLDDVPKTVEFVSGKVTEIRWENMPQMAQIQITKKSGNDNEVNGLPAGTPLAGAVFEAYEYKSGNLADRFVSGSDGRAVSAPLPLGRYTIKEVQAPQWYKLSDKALDVELEFATQIVKLEYLNYAANTGVTIRKTGVAECMPGNVISYTVKTVQNTSTVPLTDFYWRDSLPTNAVRLTKIVTGSYNQALKYKVIVTTNKGDTRIIADNLSTTKNNVIDCSNASLGMKSDEYVTSFTLMFGTVKAGFAQVEQPQIFVKVSSTLQNKYQFANKTDAGGKYASEWVVGNSTWLTTIFTKPVKLPRTGY